MSRWQVSPKDFPQSAQSQCKVLIFFSSAVLRGRGEHFTHMCIHITFDITASLAEHLPLTSLNPSHSNVSMYILHTVLYTFLKVLTRRICLPIKSFFRW